MKENEQTTVITG